MTQPDEISQVVRCSVCFETEPHTGTCGSSDPRALCNLPTPAEARGEVDGSDAMALLEELPELLLLANSDPAHERLRGIAPKIRATRDTIATLARQLAEAKAENERLRAMLPSPPSGQRKDFTIHEWRMAAMHYESQWGAASHHCAVLQTRAEQAEQRVAKGLQFTDATIDKLQEVMALHGFAVPVRVISDAFRTARYAATLPPPA